MFRSVSLSDRGLDEDEADLDEGLHRQVRQLATSQNEIELLIVLDRRGFARFLITASACLTKYSAFFCLFV